MADPDRLARLVRVEPPAELDRCVRQRLLAAVEAEKAAPTSTGVATLLEAARLLDGRAQHRDRTSRGAPVSVPLAERVVYVFGLLGYGAHALGAAARLVWRSVAG